MVSLRCFASCHAQAVSCPWPPAAGRCVHAPSPPSGRRMRANPRAHPSQGSGRPPAVVSREGAADLSAWLASLPVAHAGCAQQRDQHQAGGDQKHAPSRDQRWQPAVDGRADSGAQHHTNEHQPKPRWVIRHATGAPIVAVGVPLPAAVARLSSQLPCAPPPGHAGQSPAQSTPNRSRRTWPRLQVTIQCLARNRCRQCSL